MDLTPNTCLHRTPNLRVQILDRDEIIVFKQDQWLKCPAHGLAILDAFAQSIAVFEAVRKLEKRFVDPVDRARALDAIADLYRAGFLQTDGQRTSATLQTKPTFACFLDEQSCLLPYRARSSRDPASDSKTLVINKRIQIQKGSGPPEGSADAFPYCARFLSGYPILWVEDTGTKILAPYWLNDKYLELIQGLIAGEISPSELDQSVSTTLAAAKVLVPAEHEESQTRQSKETFANLFMQLQSQQYAIVRRMIHPLQIAALRRYFRTLDHKNFLVPDVHGPTVRYFLHNEEVAMFVHRQMTNLVRCVTRELIKPSYCFLSQYKSGAVLTRHIDRPQCLWNVSLLIDADPDREVSDSWPIYLEVGHETKAIRLEMGDGLLYRGTEIPHWREKLGDGETATLMLCHFVPEDFAGDLD